MASGARKALSCKTSAAASESACTAAKLAAQVVATDLGYRPRAGRRVEPSQAARAVTVEIALECRSGCHDVSRCLLQRKRQSVQLAGQFACRASLCLVGALSPATAEEKRGRVLDR